MKKSILTLLALLVCVIQPITAYEYFTIYFCDGTKSEAFYATDVDSICYSKISLDSIAYDDWQVQEIYTVDSVYRYPLAQIDSLSFKDVDENIVKSDVERISDTVIPLYLQSSSLSEISAYLPNICQTDGVEDAWTDNQSLFIKIRDWGTISFIYPLRRTATKSDIIKSRQLSQQLRRSIQDYNSNDAQNICIVNQMYNSRQFDYDTELKDSLERHCQLWGLDTRRIDVPTRDFYKNEMFDYDIVFLDTHGFYDYKGLHWLLTGEKVMQSINEYDSSHEINTSIEELLDWPLLWKERIFSLKHGSPLDISLSWVKDSLDNGKWRASCYVAVSQNFIKSSQNKFKSKGKAIVFNAACQSVKDNPGMAAVFTREKGAGYYLGYDDTNTVGGQAGVHYIEYLLSGKSVEGAYKQMWQDSYMSTLCKQDTIIDNQRICPVLHPYTYGVKTDTLRITHPKTLDVEIVNLDESIGYVFKGEMRTNDNSFYGSKNGYALYVSDSPDFSKCELLADIQFDDSHQSKIVWSFPAIVLEPNKQYYYVAAFTDGYSDCYGEIKSFTTKGGDAEAYYVWDSENKTATYYYDEMRKSRFGWTMKIEKRHYVNNSCEKVIFDSSFVDYYPNYFGFSAHNLTNIENLNYLNTDSITSMNGMFEDCSSLTSIDVSNFDTSNVTDMRGVFAHCFSLTSLDLNSFNTINVTNMGHMFRECSALTNLELSSFNTSNVTDMNYMFDNCSSLTSLNLSNFNTSNVTDMTGMFCDCSSLIDLDLSSFNTPKVVKSSMMFNNCSSLTTLDLSNSYFYTNYTYRMFGDCKLLKTIYAIDWFVISSGDFMFVGCDNLVGGQGTKIGENIYGYDVNGSILYYNCSCHGMAAHIDGGKDNPGLFTAK